MIGTDEQKQTINPEFPTGDLNGFLTEMQQPLQNMDIDERPLETDAFNSITDEMPEEINLQMKAGPAKATAKMLTAVIDNTIPAAFAMWRNAGGKPVQGLINRRKAEADLYFS